MKRLFGFSTRGTGFPTPLISWVEEAGVVHAVYPNGEGYPATSQDQPVTERDVKLKKSFIAHAQNTEADSFDKLTAFALNAQQITVGTPQEILAMLEVECANEARTADARQALTDARDNWRKKFAPSTL